MKKQSILVTIFIMFFVFIVGIFSFSFFSERISSLLTQIDEADAKQKDLRSKLDTLKKASSDIVNSDELVTFALPSENPMVYVVSQVKRYAQDLNLKVGNVRMQDSGTKTNDLLTGTLDFSIVGSYQGIIQVLEKLRRSFPITVVNKVKVDPSSNDFRATVTLTSYWASFPATIPSISEAITGLSASESATISQIASFDKPQVIELPPASPSSGLRNNPFAF